MNLFIVYLSQTHILHGVIFKYAAWQMHLPENQIKHLCIMMRPQVEQHCPNERNAKERVNE